MAKSSISSSQSVSIIVFVAVLSGLILGMIAKLADESGIPGIGMIGSHFGFWIVCVTAIAIWSSAWWHAIAFATSFLLMMTVAYYATQMVLFGYFSPRLFLGWAAIALVLTPPFAALTFHARGVGWLASLGAALPIGLLLQEAYGLKYRLTNNVDYQLLFLFDTICAMSLILVLAKNSLQRVRVIVLALIVLIITDIGFNRILPLFLGALQ